MSSIDFWTKVPQQCNKTGKFRKRKNWKEAKMLLFLVDKIMIKEREFKRHHRKMFALRRYFNVC